MKLKALNTFYVQNEKRVVSVGDEFETTTSHGNDLIKNGMAEFIAESELDNSPESNDEDAVELKSKITGLEGVITEKDQVISRLESSAVKKDQKIADLETQLSAANEQLTALTNSKDLADKVDDKGKNKK
ncbi:MAG: hypothetical protein ACRCXK_10190 [Wohlfahrtiimonas sp.]